MTSKIKHIADGVKQYFGDSLQNLLTGMGVSGIDKSMATHFSSVDLNFVELENAYDSDWLVGKVCDLPPFDMIREWRTMDGSMSSEQLKQFTELEEELNIQEKVKDAMVYARIYGGAGIILNIDDGLEPHEPVDFSKLKKGCLKGAVVSDMQFLTVGKIDHNPFQDNYGYPETYRLNPTSIELHHTRVIRFEGFKLPLQSRRRNRYWGKSVIERAYTALKRAGEAQENIGAMLHEATIDIIRIPDLMTMLAGEDTKLELQQRFATAKLQKSVNRMLIMDIDEEYEQHQQTFTGLVDILEKFLSIVSGAYDIPITRLFGQSPAGMNSTGESDLRNYYDGLTSQQKVTLTPKMRYYDIIAYIHLFGQYPKEKELLEFTWNPLWQHSDEEVAELETKRAERDDKYLANNVINEAVIARNLEKNKTYSAIDTDYVKDLEKVMDDIEDQVNGDIDDETISNENDDLESDNKDKEIPDK